ncbi:ferredoxin family protein [Nitratireductor sp. XY-223]|uniref:4Fe-4S dicluster domain-containing protein n=1 Tax=Nitratireductor sp. XY-223 TaxID=2561926 RepID=UPI0010AB0465|nr:ferredoxin family protein [Nitratireductor sp. XY-223]
MTLIIKSECIDVKDGECTAVCPVDCIYEGARMYYIHPVECIECGLCESVCPVDAIRWDDEVAAEDEIYVAINREYFEDAVTGLGSPGGWNSDMPADKDHPLVAAAPRNPLADTAAQKESSR